MTRTKQIAMAVVCAVVALSYAAQPAAAQMQDLTTWLFAEGSTNANFGFEQELLIGNPNPSPVTVTFEPFTQDGQALAPVTRTIPALSRYGEYVRALVGEQAGVALRLRSSAPIVAERSMYWGAGLYRSGTGTGARINTLRGGHNEKGTDRGARTWYFAEGESRFFWTFFAVANPNATPATVQVIYVDLNGNSVTEQRVIRAQGRETFWPSDPSFLRSARFASRTGGFSTIVTADVDVIAERQMYWGPNGGYDGGHAAMGIKELAADWFFAEGSQGGPLNFDTWLLMLNPGTTPLDVRVDFFDAAGHTLATSTRTIGPRARGQVWAGEFDALRNQAFSARVTAAQPFAAERAVYWRNYAEGHATAGATTAARKWGFAEGKQGGFELYQDATDADKRRFNTFFALFNPNPTPTDVTFQFYVEQTDGGQTGTTVTRRVEANSRATLWTLEVPELANVKFATFLSATQPIVAERIVYWGANFRAGHGSVGTPLPDDMPVLAAPLARSAPAATLRVTPNRGLPTGGTVVQIDGAGFGHSELGTQVLFGGQPAASFEVENGTTIRAVTPPGPTGPADVTVLTRGQSLTAPGAFTFVFADAAIGPPLNTYNGRVDGNCTGGGRPCRFVTSFENIVRDVARRQPFDVLNSCRQFGGNERFMEDVVAELRLRTGTNRWGLNIKRGNQGLSEDIVTYYYGPEGTRMRNSTQVFIIDMIVGHCGPRPEPIWIDQTKPTEDAGTIGRWTTDVMCAQPRYRNATRPNGDWLFPECR